LNKKGIIQLTGKSDLQRQMFGYFQYLRRDIVVFKDIISSNNLNSPILLPFLT
jgi:hypothetical protein